MCMCKYHHVNGTPGAYCWNDGRTTSTYPVTPPEYRDEESVLFDEPGRCVPGLDSHSHHVALTRYQGSLWVVCRHGGGTVRHRINPRSGIDGVCAGLESNARYLLLLEAWRMADGAAAEAHDSTSRAWRTAIAQKRVKVRRRKGLAYVSIEPATV